MSTQTVKQQQIQKLMKENNLTPRAADYYREKAKPSHWIAKISGVFGCVLVASAYPSYENLQDGLVGSMALAGLVFIAVGVASWRNSSATKRQGQTADAKQALACLKKTDNDVLSEYMAEMQQSLGRTTLLTADIANIEELSAMVTLQAELDNLAPAMPVNSAEPA